MRVEENNLWGTKRFERLWILSHRMLCSDSISSFWWKFMRLTIYHTFCTCQYFRKLSKNIFFSWKKLLSFQFRIHYDTYFRVSMCLQANETMSLFRCIWKCVVKASRVTVMVYLVMCQLELWREEEETGEWWEEEVAKKKTKFEKMEKCLQIHLPTPKPPTSNGW